jgi:hypothetical protein
VVPTHWYRTGVVARRQRAAIRFARSEPDAPSAELNFAEAALTTDFPHIVLEYSQTIQDSPATAQRTNGSTASSSTPSGDWGAISTNRQGRLRRQL